MFQAQAMLRGGAGISSPIAGGTGSFTTAAELGTGGVPAGVAGGARTGTEAQMANPNLVVGNGYQAHHALLMLVVLEAAALLWARRAFRMHHAG
jgi:hypothetical protein